MNKLNKSNSHCEPVKAWQSHKIASHTFAMTGECGRSMVEMLGVLAVIGVLSVAGIAGYTSAMNKHRANELLNEASKRATVVAMQIAAGQTPSIGEFSDEPNASQFSIISQNPTNDKQFNIQISGISKEVCEQLKKMMGGVIRGISDCPSGESGTITLTYNNDMSQTPYASDYKTSADCKSPFSWCSVLNKCQSEGESCECPLNSSVDGAGSGTISGTSCKCNGGYKLNGVGTSCVSALGQYKEGSIFQKHAYLTETDDGCPDGYTWTTKAEIDELTADQIESIYTNSDICDNCTKGGHWLSTCFENDCSTGYAWGLYRGHGALKASRETGHENGYGRTLCTKDE